MGRAVRRGGTGRGTAPLSSCLVWPLLIGCQLGGTVVRVQDGRPTEGRWVSPAAYASFLEGSLAEAAGNADAAAAHYQRVLDEDPRAGEAWARLGAVRCRSAPEVADRAFERARALEPELATGWLAAAECDLERGDAAHARVNAARGLALDPRGPEATRVLALALARGGDPEGARRLRVAYGLLVPGAPASRPPPVSLELTLASGDEAAVRESRVAARIPLAQVALQAVRAGRLDLARAIASRVLAAEPGNSDALIALIAVRDLATADDGTPWPGPLPGDRTPPSPLGRELMAELLARRSGDDAARAFTSALPSP